MQLEGVEFVLDEVRLHGPAILLLGTLIMSLAGWWCQWVRYPAFHKWPPELFLAKHKIHTFQISLVVVPGMLLQVIGSLLMVLSNAPLVLSLISWACVVASLVPTFCISGPIHHKLSLGKSDPLISRLIQTNLPRTLAWTLHVIVALTWWIFF